MNNTNTMNRALHVIMPMAGDVSRVRRFGWKTPKPIIEINGHFLFGHAYNSLSNLIDKCSGKVKLSCVVRDNDE